MLGAFPLPEDPAHDCEEADDQGAQDIRRSPFSTLAYSIDAALKQDTMKLSLAGQDKQLES